MELHAPRRYAPFYGPEGGSKPRLFREPPIATFPAFVSCSVEGSGCNSTHTHQLLRWHNLGVRSRTAIAVQRMRMPHCANPPASPNTPNQY